ncbi:hypothetical protein TNCV_4853001 [Trichonephila clavipes]|nr:hypothetical protein TNCV_4853001 [Trichonephila clavipes]
MISLGHTHPSLPPTELGRLDDEKESPGVYGEETLSRAHVVEWHKWFLGERDNVEDDERALRPRTATAGSDVVQSGCPIFDDFFQHLWVYRQ